MHKVSSFYIIQEFKGMNLLKIFYFFIVLKLIILVFTISICLHSFILIKLILCRLFFNFLKKNKFALIYFSFLTFLLVHLQDSFLMNSHDEKHDIKSDLSQADKLKQEEESKLRYQKMLAVFITGFVYGTLFYMITNRMENALIKEKIQEGTLTLQERKELIKYKDSGKIVLFGTSFSAGFAVAFCVIYGLDFIIKSFISSK